MKKIIGVALAALIGSLAIGTIPANAEDITAEKFISAFRDNYTGYTYKNTMNMEKFVVALEDGYKGYTYKNITNQEKFVSALEDDYTPGRYDAIMDRGRFAALHEDNRDAVMPLPQTISRSLLSRTGRPTPARRPPFKRVRCEHV